MPDEHEQQDANTFRFSKRLADFFNAHRIRTTPKKNVHRWKEGDAIRFAPNARFHAYSMLLTGNHVTQLQCFSYSFSPLDQFIRIGRYCSIAKDVRLMGVQHEYNFVTSSEILSRKNGFFSDTFEEFGTPEREFFQNDRNKGHTTIGNDVWIGQDVLIRNGVTIGTGAVIGAGALVTKDVPPYAIVGGVPARLLKMRFDDDVAAALLELEWWSYAIPQLPAMPWDRPRDFIAAMREKIARGDVIPFTSDLGRVRDVIAQTG